METDEVAYWLDIADKGIGVAEDLYKKKRWLYVAFMCHQVIEKTLKAYQYGTQSSLHNHEKLADINGLYGQMTEDQKDFINTITNYDIQARCPETKYNTLTPQVCQKMIDKTKEMTQWIRDTLSVATSSLPS